jgi:hypothetical protein
MPHHVLFILLVSFLLLCLLRLCSLWWPHTGPVQSRAAAKMRSTLHRLLKPRTADDCPACRLAFTASSGVEPAPLPVRPWSEVKSRRGAPKRIRTSGFACPNQQCSYFAITDASIHASLGRWQARSCRADPNVSLPGLQYHGHLQEQHCPVPPENAISAGRNSAGGAG